MFIIKLLSQHVSGIIMPIIRRTIVYTAAYGVLPYAAVHTLVLLMMGIMISETCWDKSMIINIRLVASCWFLSLHPTFMMHGHKNLKFIHGVMYNHGILLWNIDFSESDGISKHRKFSKFLDRCRVINYFLCSC